MMQNPFGGLPEIQGTEASWLFNGQCFLTAAELRSKKFPKNSLTSDFKGFARFDGQNHIMGALKKWIYYPWVKGFSEPELVSDDSAIEYSIGISFCEDFQGDYMVLKTFDSTILAKPWEQMIILPEPKFKFGDPVKEIEGKQRVGKISNLTWNFKNESFQYSLEVDGKVRSRIYPPEELDLIDPR